MKILNLVLIFLVIIGFQPGVHADSNLEQIDSSLIKERLRKAYSDFRLRLAKDWRATYQGKTEKWKWTEKGWKCSGKDVDPICKEWLPLSLKWWASSRGGWAGASPVKKLGYDVGRSKAKIATASPVSPQTPDPSLPDQPAVRNPAESSPADASAMDIRKWADEVWSWHVGADDEIKLYISARDQMIDRIESKEGTEYLDWTVRPGHSPDLQRIVMERGDTRVSLVKSGS